MKRWTWMTIWVLALLPLTAAQADDEINWDDWYGGNVDDAPWIGEMSALVAPFVETVRWGALSVHGDQVALDRDSSSDR